MYKNFFGLSEKPFNVNPDPRFLYHTATIRKILAELRHGINDREAFMLLTGEVGTGKTTLINCLLEWLHDQKTPTAFIFNCNLSTEHFLEFVLNDFGIPYDVHLMGNMLLSLKAWLLEQARSGRTPVLIVDEGQGLSLELFEDIRLLLNMETPSRKLLQIVLAGQPELEDRLRVPEMRHLRQRITLQCKTAPLTCEETREYIRERLRIAGASDPSIFEFAAMDASHRYAGGIPRVLNLICERALINACEDNLRRVSVPCVEKAARDFARTDVAHAPARHVPPAVPRRNSPHQPPAEGIEPRTPLFAQAANARLNPQDDIAIAATNDAVAEPAIPEQNETSPAAHEPGAEATFFRSSPVERAPMRQPRQNVLNRKPGQNGPQRPNYAVPAASAPPLVSGKSAIPPPKQTPRQDSPNGASVAVTTRSSSSASSKKRNAPSPPIRTIFRWSHALDIWWSNNFSRQLCRTALVSAAVIGSILFFLSSVQLGASEDGNRLASVIFGCLGVVFIAVSLVCGGLLLNLFD